MTVLRPPFRAEHVGSLLRPAALKDARAQLAAGAIDAAALAAVEDREIERVVRRQESIGLRGVTDGELRRSWWHLDFLWGLAGVARHTTNSGVAFAGAAPRSEGVRIDGRIRFEGHPMLAHFEFLKQRARALPKLTLPAPSALTGRPVLPPVAATAYASREQLYADLGAAYRAAVGAFAAAGCRYLQLDEVFIAMLCDAGYRAKMTARGDDPDALLELYARLINEAIADIPPDMTVTLHLCRGNFRSTFMGEGGYEAVQDVLFNQIGVHGYFMEYDDERSGGFEPLRFLPKGKRVVLGLVTTKSGRLESSDALKRRIDAAARFADPAQLCLSPQCGFASTEEGNLLTEDEQWAKLARVVEVAADVWG
ncbi:MAG TPA: 5-methyltetrahydropteroyltriglutamate--homocysteine S-methyltransferase [Gammaproteobacteria bacterium]|nr:5-methyltetrahydropteroyltriglutamate--homocysteine S-methyltransferase [Gammaproteobacteria bacterium]